MQTFLLRHWVHPLDNLAVNLTAKSTGRGRDGLIKVLVTVSHLGRLVMTRLRVNVKRLEGADWSVIYVGEEFSVEELRHVLFSSPAAVTHLDRVFLWQVPALVRRFSNDGEFVLCELNRLIRWCPRVRYAFSPSSWVRQVLDISRPMDDIAAGMNQNLRRNVRKMQETGFTCEYTQEPAKFDVFYYKMYRPYISARHGNRAIVSKYYEKRHEFDRGGLMLVKHKGQLVTGMLYQIFGNTCRLGSMGVYEENSHLVNKGAIVALYWFMLDWARRQGFHALDFGTSRARLSDGVFNFKRQWGTSLQAPLPAHTNWLFAAQTITPDLCRFINAQGFLGLVDGEWRAVMFETPEVHPAKDEVECIRRMAQKAGVAGVLILPCDESSPSGQGN